MSTDADMGAPDPRLRGFGEPSSTVAPNMEGMYGPERQELLARAALWQSLAHLAVTARTVLSSLHVARGSDDGAGELLDRVRELARMNGALEAENQRFAERVERLRREAEVARKRTKEEWERVARQRNALVVERDELKARVGRAEAKT